MTWDEIRFVFLGTLFCLLIAYLLMRDNTGGG